MSALLLRVMHGAPARWTRRHDRVNRSGTALACMRCGLIQWFGKSPDRVYE